MKSGGRKGKEGKGKERSGVGKLNQRGWSALLHAGPQHQSRARLPPGPTFTSATSPSSLLQCMFVCFCFNL